MYAFVFSLYWRRYCQLGAADSYFLAVVVSGLSFYDIQPEVCVLRQVRQEHGERSPRDAEHVGPTELTGAHVIHARVVAVMADNSGLEANGEDK